MCFWIYGIPSSLVGSRVLEHFLRRHHVQMLSRTPTIATPTSRQNSVSGLLLGEKRMIIENNNDLSSSERPRTGTDLCVCVRTTHRNRRSTYALLIEWDRTRF
jgi:hypothetical protein